MTRLTLDWRKTKLLCDLGISDLGGFFKRHAPYKLGQITRAGDGTSTAKCLKFDVADGVVALVDSDLEFHHITAGRSSDQAGSNVHVGF